jgi:HlyD family secretion protein
MSKKKLIYISAAIVTTLGAVVAWWVLSRPALPPGFAGGNGRLEAKELSVATKYPGRIKTVLVDEGDTVDTGQVVATIDTEPLEAQLRQAQADITGSEDSRRVALADVKIREAELDYADKQYKRSKELVPSGAVSVQERDIDYAKLDSARAALVGAQAQAVRAQSAIDAATAEAEKLTAQIKDNTLRAPIRARVRSRLAEPGEVLGAGGKVLVLDDLSDVYMYVFLPAGTAGKVALGSEGRIVLDAIPEYPIRAQITYVSPTAQFTPKTVETAEERHNLTFRVKLQIDRNRLRQYERFVKVGIPGMGYVRYNESAAWPAALQLKPVTNIRWSGTGSITPKD